MRRLQFFLIGLTALSSLAFALYAEPQDRQPLLFDGHIHYNQDVWGLVSVERALELLESAGIARALVSSTPTEGTHRLFERDPARIVPVLRPYRSSADRRTWFTDPDLIAWLKTQLTVIPYRGIGEIHVFGADASSPIIGDMIDLAKEHGLFLHVHADEDAIVRIAERASGHTVVWAHAGFDVPVATLRDLLTRYSGLMMELSFRDDIAPGGTIADDWQQLLIDRSDRFLVGMDTYTASRWVELDRLADSARGWLAQLPDDAADRITWRNAAALVGSKD